MRSRWRSFLSHFKCNQSLPCTFRFCLEQWCPTDEILFFQVNEQSETSFERIAVRKKIRAIERVTHFEPESVAGAETARFHSEFATSCQCVLPELGCNLSRKEDFETVFSSIPSSCNRDYGVRKLEIRDLIARRRFFVISEPGPEKFDRTRSLNGNGARVRAAIAQFQIGRLVFFEPGEVFIYSGGIHDQEELRVSCSVNNQIVNDPTTVV